MTPTAVTPIDITAVIARLAALGFVLPTPAAPVAAYVPSVEIGGLLHISGQLPFRDDGSFVTGRLGADVDLAGGQVAAQLCGRMLIAQIGAALDGDFSRLVRIVKLGVFVNSTTEFDLQPLVANGASELMEAVFGAAGKHARSAVGVAMLPRGAAVEIDAIVAVRAA